MRTFVPSTYLLGIQSRTQKTARLFALVYDPGAKRPEVLRRPEKHMRNLPAPRSETELWAPKTTDIRGGRDCPAAGLQAPFMRDYNREKGDQGQNFPIS